MPSARRRPRPRPQTQPRIDLQRLLAASRVTEVTHDYQLAPARMDALVTLDRWSLAVLDGTVHVMGVSDWGEVVSLDVDALARDRSWVRRADGTHLRLLEPWHLPFVHVSPRGGRA